MAKKEKKNFKENLKELGEKNKGDTKEMAEEKKNDEMTVQDVLDSMTP